MSNSNPLLTAPAAKARDLIPSWPEQAFPLQDVQTWVASVLDLPDAAVITPVAVYAAYTDAPDQRLTARLVVADASTHPREVVFKGNRFPLLAGSARVHALVSRCCPGRVPRVLAWEDDGGEGDGSSRLLYQPFEGRSVGEAADPALLVETARTLAQIQIAVAAAASGEIDSAAGIPGMGAQDIPAAFEAVCAHVAAHIAAWQQDEGGSLSQWLNFPAKCVLGLLGADYGSRVARCAEQVIALGLPVTIDHGDLHGGNAVVQENGRVLIYDWETATLGCPLFSVEKLLVAAWRLDEKPEGGGPWGYVPGTPTQALVRDAYLGALGRANIGERAFAAAMCLAVVKEMHAEIAWANRMGWPNGNPEWTAQLIRRLRHHLLVMSAVAG